VCRDEIIIMMERERVLSWPELCLTGSWTALDPSILFTVDAGYKQLGYKKTRLLPTNFFPPAKLFFIMYYKNSDTRNSLIRKLGFRKANF